MLFHSDKTVLHVEGMSCSHCEHAVKTAVEGLDGVKKAVVSLPEKTVTVQYQAGKVTPEQMSKAIEEQGYTVVK